MKTFNWSALYGILVIANVSCSPSGENNPKPNHIIVIGVDALSPHGIVNANTPVMDDIMANGAYTLNARGVLPTSSSSNWASMVSGAGPEQHGVTSNAWERDDRNFPPVTTGMEDIFPTIFGLAREQKPELEIGAVYTWTGFGRLIENSALNHDVTEETDPQTIENAVSYIKTKKPDLLFIHLDHVDHVGHNHGHKTEAFYQAVNTADQQIGSVIQASKDAGTFDETVFIVSADHGGIGYGHGGESIDELEIPFLIYGMGAKKGYLLKNKIYTYDNAATVAYLLNLDQPFAWIGKPVKEAFEGYPEPNLGNQKIIVASPIIYPKANLLDPSGGLFVDQQPEVRIDAKGVDEIRYTLDGTIPHKNSMLYEAPFTLSSSAVVQAKSFAGSNGESNVSKAYFRLVSTTNNNGIDYRYYEGEGWRFLPVFESLKAVKEGTRYQFRIDDINQKDAQFGIQFSSFLKIDQAGEYRFYTISDDGSKLYINNDLIVDNDGDHGAIERMGNVRLDPGYHSIKVDYFNQSGGFWLDVYYKGPGQVKQIIPADRLFLTKQ